MSTPVATPVHSTRDRLTLFAPTPGMTGPADSSCSRRNSSSFPPDSASSKRWTDRRVKRKPHARVSFTPPTKPARATCAFINHNAPVPRRGASPCAANNIPAFRAAASSCVTTSASTLSPSLINTFLRLTLQGLPLYSQLQTRILRELCSCSERNHLGMILMSELAKQYTTNEYRCKTSPSECAYLLAS
jgi:hypothetical protein